jgi:L-serine kinase (ATP) / ParB family transcriptional regulator, heme-responsive regulator
MIPDLPHLCFLPIGSLIFHEWHDTQRTPPLIERIRESGLFRNPPIVAPLDDGSGRYMVLDGANRITALREMGFPDVLLQVVQADDPGLELENWNHVVWKLNPKAFFTAIRDINGIHLALNEEAHFQPDLTGECGLAAVQIPRGKRYAACASARELLRRVELLHAIVDSYKDRASLDRTSVEEVSQLAGIYPNLSGLVTFPNFQISDILRLAGEGYLLPTGITRFTVSPRALHVNYPLFELASSKPLAEKNADLQEWIQKRIAQKGVRYYEEATFLYDE